MRGRRAAGRIAAALLAALFLLGALAGCGRKAKPAPKWAGPSHGRPVQHG